MVDSSIPHDKKDAGESAATHTSGSEVLHRVLLVVSDAEAAREIIGPLERSGVDAIIVFGFDACSHAIAELQPSLVVVDSLRIDLDIPAHPRKAGIGIPMLVLVRDGTGGGRRRMIEAGASALVAKPFDESALHGFVLALLHREGSNARTVNDPFASLFSNEAGTKRAHIESVARHWESVLGSEEQDDVVQEVLLAFWRHFPKFVNYDYEGHIFRMDLDDKAVIGWLTATTNNVCQARRRTELRRQRKAHALASYMQSDAFAPRTSDIERFFLLDELRVLLRDLSDRDRDIVLGHHFSGLSCAELAAKHGVSAGTIRSIIWAALKTIRNRAE